MDSVFGLGKLLTGSKFDGKIPTKFILFYEQNMSEYKDKKLKYPTDIFFK